MKVKSTLFVLLVCLCSFIAKAQQKYPSTLLWRISGKNLQQPSYLYGTIHLQDRRLFFFGDSLYRAIENTRGFAMEINPDEMMDSLFKTFDSKDTSAYLKKILDKSTYQRIAGKLSKKLKIPAEKITVQRFAIEKNKWLYNSKRRDDMPVAMDLYLYNIARKQGKETGGIEDVSDQLGLLNDFSIMDIDAFMTGDTVKKDNYIEQLKKIYIEKDLTALDQLVNGNSNEAFKDLLLIKRNLKMAVRIDSIANLRSNFFAVGAAHLPGETGLIYLLQKAGFTVEPVFSSANIDPAKYHYTARELKWQEVEDNDKIISVQMPGTPTELMAGSVTPMKMYMDIGDMTYYAVGVASVNEEDAKSDTFFNKVIRNYKKMDMELLGTKNIEYKGAKGIEMTALQAGENYFRYRLMLYGSRMVIIIYGARDKERLYDANAEKYLTSLNYNQNAFTGTKKWQQLSNEKNAFTMEFPGKAIIGTEKDEEGSVSDKYSFADLSDGSYYAMVVKDMDPGYYINDDSVYFEEYHTNLDIATKKGVKEFTISNFNGYPSCYYAAVQKEDNKEYILRGYMIRRGGRTYMPIIVAQKYKADFPEFTKFFRSLELLPFKERGWKQYPLPSGAVSLMAPGELNLVQKKDSLQDTEEEKFSKYTVTDKNAALSFSVEALPLSPYFWATADSSFLGTKARSFKGWNDSIVSYTYNPAPVKSATVIIKLDKTDTYKKMKVFLAGDTLYTLYSFQPQALLQNRYFNTFFDSIKLLHNYPVTAFSNKAAKLLDALQSADSAASTDALAMLNNVPFTKADLPLLFGAMAKKYRSFPDEYKTVNEQIADAIVALNDSSSIDFAIAGYNIVNDTAADIQVPLLNILAALKTAPAFEALKKLMLEQPPVSGKNFNMLAGASDTLQLAADLFPAACSLYADTVVGPAIINIAVELLDTNIIKQEVLLQNEKGLHILAEKQLKMLKEDDDTYVPYNYQVIELLRRFNSKASNDVLRRFAALKTLWVKNDALLALIKNNQPVLPADCLLFAKDKSWRTQFYDDLKKMNRTALFPKAYYTQEKFAESYLYEFLTEEYEIGVEKMQFIKTATASINGATQKYFIYKIMNSDEDSKVWQLAFCGPFVNNSAVAEIDIEAQDIFLDDEDFNAAKIDSRFKKFIADKSPATGLPKK